MNDLIIILIITVPLIGDKNPFLIPLTVLISISRKDAPQAASVFGVKGMILLVNRGIVSNLIKVVMRTKLLITTNRSVKMPINRCH